MLGTWDRRNAKEEHDTWFSSLGSATTPPYLPADLELLYLSEVFLQATERTINDVPSPILRMVSHRCAHFFVWGMFEHRGVSRAFKLPRSPETPGHHCKNGDFGTQRHIRQV